ncbi:MAG: hypothetical protein FJ100_00775 [Deltaproteobacteria bacterium]|nr:hypothetical protein [Deltaproteobacteria bacterium]
MNDRRLRPPICTLPARVAVLGCVVAVFAARSAWAAAADADADGLQDGWEVSYFGNLGQGPAGDPDGDGLNNGDEFDAGTDPTLKDTDGDGLLDLEEIKPAGSVPATNPLKADTDGDFLTDHAEVVKFKTNPTKVDTDGDGLPDNIELQVTKSSPLQVDTDNGFSDDGAEVLIDGTDPTDPSDDTQDKDGDGLSDWKEENVYNTNRLVKDTDGDGLDDGEEVKKYKTKPTVADTDGDGLVDGFEVSPIVQTDPLKADSDGDGLSDGAEVNTHKTLPLVADTDWDTLADGKEVQLGTSPLLADSDGGGVYDPVELSDGSDPKVKADDAGKDPDGDGLSTNYEDTISKTNPTDADGDGDKIDDGQEVLPLKDRLVTNPKDADTDDDGLLDGNEGGISKDGSAAAVTGGTSPTLYDTDADKLSDAVELGAVALQVSAKDPKATAIPFQADLDPASLTDVFGADTDGDGLLDGDEDANHNGKWEAALGETDPAKKDTDGDGMDDGWEVKYAVKTGEGPPLLPLDPSDGPLDSDGDGLTNVQEYSVKKPDDKGAPVANPTNPRAKDSDADGILDSVEVNGKYGGKFPAFAGSDPNVADSDGDGIGDGVEDKNKNGATEATESNPKKADSDGDNLADGSEDANKNGVWDKALAETDPTQPDSDGDGVNDGLEVNFYGTNPLVVDTDGDGLPDGLELGKKGDADPASTTNPKGADTDGDGLTDAAEDANKNGKVDATETNPGLADTDGDGLADGLEIGKAGDSDPASKTNPLAKDTDGDGLFDAGEDKNKNGKVDPGETDPNVADTDKGGTPDGQEVQDGTNALDPADDSAGDLDGDGLKNPVELKAGLDPKNPDTDGDTIADGHEAPGGQLVDTDGDGTPDAKDEDSDGDGWLDKDEAGDADWKTPPKDTDGDGEADYRSLDSDADQLPDGDEKKQGTQRTNPDSDGDGMLDGPEVQLGTSPLDRDSDDDGLADDAEPPVDGDGDGLIGPLDADRDNDGVWDSVEAGLTAAKLDNHTDLAARAFRADADPSTITNPDAADSDMDGVRDGAEDWNHDGKLQVAAGESNPTLASSTAAMPDADADGLPDAEEIHVGTNPADADSDDDGIFDGNEWNLSLDPDRDGAPCANDADSDNDGLSDGTERNVAITAKATWLLRRNFGADEDPTTATNPLRADSDGDGLRDGLEDPNGNGKLDTGESDPEDPLSVAKVIDTDLDGLADAEELRAGTSSTDRDTDDDGVPDGAEPNALFDSDGDGLPGARDPDSDDDGIADGTELGVTKPVDGTAGLQIGGTDAGKGAFVADAQPLTKTLPLAADSDRDGQLDGFEDGNRNGAPDAAEGDPLDPTKISNAADTDADGIGDTAEAALKTKPNDADSDDDGVLDGQEANWAFDSDGDGLIDALDEDSDGDGLFDGTETGLTSTTLPKPQATALGSGVFVADKDPTTRTLARVADSDRAGLSDGQEDFSRDGKVDQGETDPENPLDDGANDGDFDGDSLANAIEVALGLDPLKPDSDADGIWDNVEVQNPVAPLDSDGDGTIDARDVDSDNDLVPDSLEHGSEPGLLQAPIDSDGDGKPDYRDTDSDGDRLPDGDELLVYRTNSRSADTDGGGLNDGIEVLELRTNPLDPADDQDTLEYGAQVRGTSPLSACAAAPGTRKAPWLAALLGAAAGCVILRRRRPWMALCALLLATTPALALQPTDVTGARPTLDGTGIALTEAARELELHGLYAGGQLQYAWRPLVVGTESKVLRPLVESRLQMDVGLSMRMFDHVTLGVVVPVSLWQVAERPSLFGRDSGKLPSDPAIADIAVGAKYVFRPDRIGDWGYAAMLWATIPAGDPVQYLGRPGPTVQPTAIVSGQWGPWRLAMTAGARIQATRSMFKVDDGPAFRWSVAGSLNPTVVRGNWKNPWMPEGAWMDLGITHETPLLKPFGDRNDEKLEAAFSLNFPIDDGIYLTAGTTVGVWPGAGVPAVRPFGMVKYGPPDRIQGGPGSRVDAR